MIYLNCAATSAQKPPCVREAVLQALESPGSSSRGASEQDLNAARTVFDARLAVADCLGATHPERVVFCANATQALNTALFGLLAPGDHAIATDYEHNSVLRPLNALAAQGVMTSYIPVDRLGRLELERLESLFQPHTRLVVISHASNLTGVVLPVREVAQAAHEHGAFVVLDAAQTAGVLPLNMVELGVDVLCFTGHKALMGPQGTGGLIVAPEVSLCPLLYGGTGVQSALPSQPDTYPEHLEAGTLNTPGIAGLGAAARWLATTGVEEVARHERALRSRFVAGVSACAGVTLYGEVPRCEHVATVALNIGGRDSAQVADELAQRFGIAVRAGLHCAPRAHAALGTTGQGAVRFSFGWFTTEAEVDCAVDAVCTLAHEAGA